jgi:hypothetical protein
MHFDPEIQRGGSSLALSVKLRRRRGHHLAASLRDVFLRIASACGRMTCSIGAELVARRHEQLLARLDDRMLADIGIARDEISVLVRSVEQHRRIDRDVH